MVDRRHQTLLTCSVTFYKWLEKKKKAHTASWLMGRKECIFPWHVCPSTHCCRKLFNFHFVADLPIVIISMRMKDSGNWIGVLCILTGIQCAFILESLLLPETVVTCTRWRAMCKGESTDDMKPRDCSYVIHAAQCADSVTASVDGTCANMAWRNKMIG